MNPDSITHGNVTACPGRNRLADLVLGRLPESEIASLFEHASRCQRCQATLDELDGMRDELLIGVQDAAGREADSEDQEFEGLVARVGSLRPDSRQHQDPDLPDALPEQLGQYQVLEKLGQGGMGAVYKALHTKLKRVVAVKVIADRRLHSPDATARFQREMEAVGGLDHPNIVRAHDAGEAGGRHFLVMEFVEGQDLAQRVRSAGPFDVADACEVIRQAAIGLDYAHQHGLVHRDVKPPNLMLTPDGTVKVLDLGLARLQAPEAEAGTAGAEDTQGAGDMTSAGQILGSRDYMAPEQKLDSREADARADIYSLGCTLHFLLTGRPPRSPQQKEARQDSSPASLPAETPPALANLLERMLAADPNDRPADMQEVIDALAEPAGTSHLSRPSRQGSSQAETPAALGTRFRRIVGALLLLALLGSLAWQWPAIIVYFRGQGELIVKGNDVVVAPKADPTTTAVANRSGQVLVNSIGMEFALIHAGDFLMGSPDSDTQALNTEKPQHRMTIPKPFYLGTHEVTVGQFRQFVEATGYKTAAESDPEKPGGWLASFFTSKGRWVSDMTWRSPGFPQTDNHPVVAVSWADAVAFCQWLTNTEGVAYRLPTEVEWEYACRAGTTDIRHIEDRSLDDFAWYAVNSGCRTQPVGQKLPNAFGLYDMYGNAREWCANWHNGALYARRAEDPAVEPHEVNNRSVRGGCYMDAAEFLRSACRINVDPTERMSNLGFRVLYDL